LDPSSKGGIAHSIDSGNDADLNMPPVAGSAACSRTEVQEMTSNFTMDIALPKLLDNAEKETVAVGHQESPIALQEDDWPILHGYLDIIDMSLLIFLNYNILRVVDPVC
jgi:hypothetical protein